MLQQLGVTVAVNLAFSLLVKNIDNWGHVGGMLGGGAVAWLLGPHMQRDPRGVWMDSPPLKWLAYPPGFGLRQGGRAVTQGKGSGDGGADIGDADEQRKEHRRLKEGPKPRAPRDGSDGEQAVRPPRL